MTTGADDRIAEEQTALGRVATLMAWGAPLEQVFATVAAETGRLFKASHCYVNRYEANGAVTVVGSWDRAEDSPTFVVGTRVHLGGRNVATQVFETGQAARIADYADASGAIGHALRAAGISSAIGVPIRFEGRLWGVLILVSSENLPTLADAEPRLAARTELLATALATARVPMDLRGFAEEQAALRRVATLVARGAPPEEVFAAVAAEVGWVLDADLAGVCRYDANGSATFVGVWARPGASKLPAAVGTRVTHGGRNLHTLIFETGRAARIDDYDTASTGSGTAAFRQHGVRAAIGIPIRVHGRLWGYMAIAPRHKGPVPADAEERLAAFTELVVTALANAEVQDQLTASRARIVATADATRRRIERDIHDGVQQHLVSLALELRAAQDLVPVGAEELAVQLEHVVLGLRNTLDELREIAHGIHPAGLAHGGLRAALKALARRSAVDVRMFTGVEERLPEPIELAAYYVVAEALTNAAKHAKATVVDVTVETRNGALRIEVRDNGGGGADAADGTGLVGLIDRVEALGGQFTIHSPPGIGTTLHAVMPVTEPIVQS
jgi:signal transduction histidine kinase